MADEVAKIVGQTPPANIGTLPNTAGTDHPVTIAQGIAVNVSAMLVL